MEFDFSGYATKNDLRCSDGRTIRKDAFKNNHGKTVPLVWQHMHNSPDNVLGHAALENREDGVYAYAKFNNTSAAQQAKALVAHGDVTQLSIYANQLQQRGGDVLHGNIREVSLVLSGANAGALIDNIAIAHADGEFTESETEAIIYTGEDFELFHADEGGNNEDTKGSDEGGSGKTIADVFNSMTDEQKNVVYYMVGQAVQDAKGGDEENDEDVEHSDEEGEDILMHTNIFELAAAQAAASAQHTGIPKEKFSAIMADAEKMGSLKAAFLAHAEGDEELANGIPGVDYGVTNLDLLFPDYRNIRDTPDTVKRDDAWVQSVIGGASKTPFAKVKSMWFDITADAARARGYKKGHLKKEEVIKAAKRVTGPTTVYKKQRLDRDDIIDITSFDIVAYLKGEMQSMLREEIARAILIGDGRAIDNEDKIDEECIRPIYSENELYAYRVELEMIDGDNYGFGTDQVLSFVDGVAMAMVDYKGSGSPTLFTTKRMHTKLKMARDKLGRKVYESDSALCDAMNIGSIVDVPVLEDIVNPVTKLPLLGIIVNMKDYNIGTNRGGETTFFDDFDIDYNQYKYLYETRMSGALTRMDSAVIIEGVAKPMLNISMAPTDPHTSVLINGPEASKLQKDIAISNTRNISGELFYYTNFTQYSEDANLSSGHFLAIDLYRIGSDTKAKGYYRLTGSEKKGWSDIPFDSTSKIVMRVTDEMQQVLKIKIVGTDGSVEHRDYSLSGLRLLDTPSAVSYAAKSGVKVPESESEKKE